MGKTIVVGDLHGNFAALNELIRNERPSVAIVAGDVEMFPEPMFSTDMWRGFVSKIEPGETDVYLVPGNHECIGLLETMYGRHGASPVAIDSRQPRVFYCPLWSTLKTPDGVVMFAGYAESPDRAFRVMGVDWFQQEVLTNVDIYAYERMVESGAVPRYVDAVVSHTCPREMAPLPLKGVADPTTHCLQAILDSARPRRWVFGHWHTNREGDLRGCRWTALNRAGSGFTWWTELFPAKKHGNVKKRGNRRKK